MKKLVFSLLYYLGGVRLAAWWNRRRVRILCYHGVTERATRSPQDPHGLHVRRDRFAAQLDYLRRNYHIVSLREYLAARSERRSLPPYSLVLTFDDGYRNFMTAAAAELARRQMPATVYLITERMRPDQTGARSDGWIESDDTLCLSWNEVQALAQQYDVEFGSHTCTHSRLTTLAAEDAARELRESQAAIAGHLDQPAISFAYPYGDYSADVSARARECGYSCALTTDEGVNDLETDEFALRRTLIGDDDDKTGFAVRVSGILAWLRRSGSYTAPEAGFVGEQAANPGRQVWQ